MRVYYECPSCGMTWKYPGRCWTNNCDALLERVEEEGDRYEDDYDDDHGRED